MAAALLLDTNATLAATNLAVNEFRLQVVEAPPRLAVAAENSGNSLQVQVNAALPPGHGQEVEPLLFAFDDSSRISFTPPDEPPAAVVSEASGLVLQPLTTGMPSLVEVPDAPPDESRPGEAADSLQGGSIIEIVLNPLASHEGNLAEGEESDGQDSWIGLVFAGVLLLGDRGEKEGNGRVAAPSRSLRR